MTEEVKITTMGMNCPKPLIETRKALRRMKPGDILIVEGDHAVSLKEIPQAVKDTGDEVISVKNEGPHWSIHIRKGAQA